MTEFKVHTAESAPEDSKEVLQNAQETYGFIPNIFGSMAEAPQLLKTYMAVQDDFGKTSLTPTEQQLVMLATSAMNKCLFCVPAHSYMLRNKVKADDAVIDAAREGRELPDAKLNALVTFTKQVVKTQAGVSEEQTQAFLDAGYTRQQALEVVLGVAAKTMTNYTSRIAATPPSEEFSSEAWTPSVCCSDSKCAA